MATLKDQTETMPRPVVRAAIYARYSSEMQSPTSAKDQIDRIIRLAEADEISTRLFRNHKIEITPCWIQKDEAVTGKTAGRSGYQAILQGIRQKAFNLLIVDDLSRLTRSLGNLLGLYQLLRHHDIELVSVSDRLSSADPNSKTFFTVKGMIADFGNDIHSERTKRGLEARANGRFSTGQKPYGYGSEATVPADRKRKASHYKIFVKPNEADVVRRIFRLYTDGYGKVSIAKLLNKEGVSPPRSNSTGWKTGPIDKILHNQKYIGRWSYGRCTYSLDPETAKRIKKTRPLHDQISFEDETLRIVPQEVWDRVQKRLQENIVARRTCTARSHRAVFGNRNRVDNLHLLSGVMVCSDCGGAMVIVSGRRDGYYGCLAAHRHGTCKRKVLLRRRDIEGRVLQALNDNIVSDPQVIRYATESYNRQVKRQLQQAPTRRKLAEKELERVSSEIANLIRFIAEGRASDIGVVSEALREREGQKARLTEELARLSQVDDRKLLVTPYLIQSRLATIVKTLAERGDRYNSLIRSIFDGPLKLCEVDGNPALKGHFDFQKAMGSTHYTSASPNYRTKSGSSSRSR